MFGKKLQILKMLPFVSFIWIPGFYSMKSLLSTPTSRPFWKANNPFFHFYLQIIFLFWPYLSQKRPQSFKRLKLCLNLAPKLPKTAKKWEKNEKRCQFFIAWLFYWYFSWNFMYLLHRYIEKLWAPCWVYGKSLNFSWIDGYLRHKNYSWLF